MIRKNSTRVKMLLLLVTTIAFGVRNTTAQVKIGDNKASVDARSILELESTDKALYLPRLSTAQINAQSGWKAGMLVYNTDSACVQHFTTKWQCLVSVSTDADNQDLSIVGDSLKISGGTGVLLAALGTDNQNLSLTTDSLLIEDGTGVKLADLAKEPWFGDDDDAGATTNTEDIYHLGHVGIGVTNPTTTNNKLDIADGNRTGTHATGRPLYVTGNLGDDSDGAEFRHSNGTQGVGIGFNSIYAAGSNANQHLNLIPKGTGSVGVGTATPAHRLHVTLPHTTNWQTRFQNGTANSYFLHGGGYGAHINSGAANTDASYALEVRNASQGAMLFVRNDGNVGINRNTPNYKLDVNGTFRSTNSGLITVMGGNDDDVADITAGGSPARGIRMWAWNNDNWGIYMSRSGAGRSLSSGTAVSGGNFTSHAMRFRVNNNNVNGFIFENDAEKMLLSIRGSDGIIRSGFLDSEITSGVARRNMVVDADGDIHSDGTRGTHFQPGYSYVGTSELELMPVGRWATIGGRMTGAACSVAPRTSTFKLEYQAASGFSLIGNYGPNSVGWTFSGAGTTADPYKAVSGNLSGCTNAARVTILVKDGDIYIKSTNGLARAANFVIETIP